MKYLFVLLLLTGFMGIGRAQQVRPAAGVGDSVLVFCYFKNNGQDGLHYAFSRDGYYWTALKHDSSFLAPVTGNDKLMRDPCIIRGADGRFHMVWTMSW